MFDKYYISYGSNLNSNVIKRHCPSAKVVGTSSIKNYRLVFKGSSNNFSYLTIESSEGYIVPVAVYKISKKDIHALDEYEGYPDLYSRKKFSIKVNGRRVRGYIYIMNNMFDYNFPSHFYFNTCIQGYEEFDFDDAYLNRALEDTSAKIKRKKM